MAYWKHLIVILATILVTNCREMQRNICEPSYGGENKLQCFCIRDKTNETIVRTANCYLLKNLILRNDSEWQLFRNISSTEKIEISQSGGVILSYIPTQAFKQLTDVKDISITYAEIKEIPPYAFANLSSVEKINVNEDQIEILRENAFAHHTQLTTITIDRNKITELSREVFVDLPFLEKLFLTSNKLTTIHDRAFIHLTYLKELELNQNKIFSLNSETFTGLRNLRRLELSRNSLEVIGDNTFLPLIHLESLNLDGNKLQMLDQKAFAGLSNLRMLSLARNMLSGFENVKIFEGLKSLVSLNIKSNNIHYLNPEVMEPILHNFYSASSNFEFDENEFSCDCKLDWLLPLRNKTSSSQLKLSIENLKCNPDADLSEQWKKFAESEKVGGATFEDEGNSPNAGEYEYYDETQLDGKLFFIDTRELLNCSSYVYVASTSAPTMTTKTHISTNPATTPISRVYTSTIKSVTTKKTVPPSTTSTTKIPEKTKIATSSVLDLSLDETTNGDSTTVKSEKSKSKLNFIDNTNEGKPYHVTDGKAKDSDRTKASFTTSRLATVSAKPNEKLKRDDDDKDMASDEAAKPDAHRQVQTRTLTNKPSSSNNIIINKLFIIPNVILCLCLI